MDRYSAHAEITGVTTFSVATRQHLSGKLEALLHPAMLTTLIYRFGSPGRAGRDIHKVQANGQCFLSQRHLLLGSDAFRAAQSSLCEDITIVHRIAKDNLGVYADPLLQRLRPSGDAAHRITVIF